MELKWLEDFLTLCSTGNFGLAANARCVSQPAFSRRIQALEVWVEASLVDRSQQPWQLTEAGRMFRPIAQKIVDLAVIGKEDIQAQLLEEKERMRFATLSTLSQIFLPVWLKSLQQFINTTQFIVKTEYVTTADYFTALEENHVDFFISYVKPSTQSRHDTSIFTSLKLGEDSFVPVASPNKDGTLRWWLPDKPKEPIPCLHSLSNDSPWPIKAHMEETYKDLTFKSVYDSSTGPTLKEMALEGFGMAWLPRALVADELASGRLVQVAEKADDIHVDIRIYRCLKYNEPRVERIWKVLLG